MLEPYCGLQQAAIDGGPGACDGQRERTVAELRKTEFHRQGMRKTVTRVRDLG